MTKMRVGVVARLDLPPALELVRKLLKAAPRGSMVLEKKLAERLGEKGEEVGEMEVEALLTVGGDGTLLGAHLLAPHLPLLGVHMGRRGFLAEVPPSEAEEAVKRMVAGKLEVEGRMALATKVGGERLPDAINDACLTWLRPGKSISFKVLLEGKTLYEARGDGLVVATPTGSTGHSLSAGGPVVEPGLEALIVNSFCTSPPLPPMVIPSHRKVEVEVTRADNHASVVVDGQFAREVELGERILFFKSERPVSFLRWRGNFYERLREKIW
ncbi:MAG: NAD(+)/NADH kinase [Candidatus Hadarchaeales archaeon]